MQCQEVQMQSAWDECVCACAHGLAHTCAAGAAAAVVGCEAHACTAAAASKVSEAAYPATHGTTGACSPTHPAACPLLCFNCGSCCTRARHPLSPDKARPHWGKSWPRVFTSTACPVRDLYPASNLAKQLSLQQQYDPSKLFETEMLSVVLAGGVARSPDPSPYCTNELGCYCVHDDDCGSPAGYGLPSAALCCQTAPEGLAPFKVCLPCPAG